MENESLQGMLVIAALASFFFGLGLATRFGALKRTFITKGIPGVYPRNTVYALMPSGLFFLYIGLASLIWGETWIDDSPIAIGGMIVILVLTLISLFWQPHWLKPAWLQWLEDNYGHVLDEMFEEARQMGGLNWEQQVKTQVDLESWANSVAQKHGWQRLI